jgi:transposase
MKLEVVTDATGLPLGLAPAAANVPEHRLLPDALADVPVPVPAGTPVVADRGHDADRMRDAVEAAGLVPVVPHRRNRVKPSRNDGRRLRRYRRRYVVERTNAWLQAYRGLAVRWVRTAAVYVEMVYLAFTHIALKRL